MRNTIRGVTAAVLLVSAACASGGSSGAGTDREFLSRDDIESVEVSDLYEVVQRLRPRWLNVRGDRSFGLTTSIVVYQGQTRLGGVDVLKQFGPETAETMRYMDGPKASSTLPGLGSQHVAGAIIIETRKH